jgi:hypothetical protein
MNDARKTTAAGTSSTGQGGGRGQGGGSGEYGQGGGSGGYGQDGGSGGSDGRPKSDPILTQRFEALDDALHGPIQATRRRALNWSGVNEATVAFKSIEAALDASVPVDRPTSDLPQTSGTKRTGG